MDIVIITGRGTGRSRRVHGGVLAVAACAIVAGAVLAGASLSGAAPGAGDDAGLHADTAGLRELARQRAEVESARRQAERHLNALALQLGKVQAHVLRLDALGRRLVDMAKLDDAEFDFSRPPAMGGPAPVDPVSANVPDFLHSLDELSRVIDDRSAKFGVLETLLMNRLLEEKVTPAGRPVKRGWISSNFGTRTDPMSGKKEFHEGMDFAGKEGSDVIAVAAGVITASGRRSGYGNLVEINHGNGYVTRYAHNRENLVKVGDKVEKGQVLARMGSTGRSTGPHTHLEVLYKGKVVNPAKFIRASR